MNARKLFMLGLTGLAFTACSNEEEISNGRQDGNVRVKISLGTTESRSLGVTADGKYNAIENLTIAFYDGSGNYVGYPASGEIGGVSYDNAQAITDAVKTLQGNTHSATLELKDIPGPASQMLIVANDKTTGDVNMGSLNAVKGSTIYLNEQSIDDFTEFSGEKSTLTGISTITDGEDNTSNVNVTLRPVTSRIELGNVTAVPLQEGDTWDGPTIKSFTVAGFYINQFYTIGALDSKMNPQDKRVVDNGSTASNYSKTYYNETLKYGFMCDEPTEVQITYTESTDVETDGYIYKAVPATNEGTAQYWGYQVLKGAPCHVVVKLNVTQVNPDTQADEMKVKFLTINRFTYAGNFEYPDGLGETVTAGTEVENFVRGYAYKVEDIQFDVKDLTDSPYETTKTLSAKVSVEPWKGVGVNPGFN